MRRIFPILALLALISCSKEELGPQCIDCGTESSEAQSADLILINEGNFGFGNGSISLYQPADRRVSQRQYFQANASPLGDVVQSITQLNEKAYVVVNNSNKIEVMDVHHFSAIATITGFNSPRYLLPVSNNTAYVTDLYANSIQVVDLQSNTITGSIGVYGWTEELVLVNDTVYVGDMTNDNLLLIDPATHLFVDSIKLGEQPNSMVVDQNNKLWILCDGGINSTNAQLIRFNPQNRSIEARFTFSNLSDSPFKLTINANGDGLYFINSSIYRMAITDMTLPLSPIVVTNNNNFYGLGIDPINEDIYVSDAIDYVQDGQILRHSSTGQLKHVFKSGIIPGGFLFVE